MLPAWVSAYIGLPFREHGRCLLSDGGLDCWGLYRLALQEQFGLATPSLVDGYDSTLARSAAQMGAVVEHETARWRRIEPGFEECGDVVILRVYGHPVHVGMVLGQGDMLHIIDGMDSCIENYAAMKWRNRVTGFYRHAERP